MSNTTLSLFPARVPIGTVQPDGMVLMTPEFVRAMRALFDRVGGPAGMATDDLAILMSVTPQDNAVQSQAITDIEATTPTDWSGHIAALLAATDELRAQANQFDQIRAELAEVRKTLEGVEIQATYRDPARVDWEHPGKIGSLTANSGAFTTISASGQITSTLATGTAPFSIASTTVVPILNVSQLLGGTWAVPGTIGSTTPNTGAFTTLTASQAVTLSPANANVVLSPTGTGVVTINPATAGAMNNVAIGATTPLTGKFTTIQSTGAAGFNGATPQTPVASGGALAAYVAGANGLDTGAHMQALHALVVSIRAALVANGIMS